MPRFVVFVVAAMLFLGAASLPYGYYTLLRIVATITFLAAAWIAYERTYPILPWVYVLFAAIFNPLIKVHFDKEVWMVIDIIAGLVLIVSGHKLTTSSPSDLSTSTNSHTNDE